MIDPATTWLSEHCVRSCRTTARRLGVDYDDLRSEVGMVLVKRSGSYDPEKGDLGAWVWSLVENTGRRLRQRAGRLPQQWDQAIDLAAPESVDVPDGDRVAEILAELEVVDPFAAWLFRAHYVAGVTYREIGARPDVQMSAAALHRRVTQLRDWFALRLSGGGAS